MSMEEIKDLYKISWLTRLRLNVKTILNQNHKRIKHFMENLHIVFMIIILILIIVKIRLESNKSMSHYVHNIETGITYAELVMYPIFLLVPVFLKFYQQPIYVDTYAPLAKYQNHEHVE